MSTVHAPDLGRPQLASAPGRFGATLAGRQAVVRQVAILGGFVAAGILETWPRATYLVQGRLPATRDAGSYVWGFWWMLHQLEHLGNPWFTRSIAAPVGSQLGFHALMPLEGVLMAPITAAFGPSASYNLLSIVMPGLLSYAAYRVARLWIPSQIGAIAAGAFYGFSPDLAWRAWYLLNLAAGALFLPLALEAAVRLRRRPGRREAAVLGVVLAASLLTDQESAVLAVGVAVAALLPWLLRREAAQPTRRKLVATAMAAVIALVVASPQIAAMAVQADGGGASYPRALVARNYVSGTSLPGVFAISPRAIQIGLTALRPASYRGPLRDGVPAYGLVLSVLAVAGLAASWRRRSAWYLALLWFGATALALGATLRVGTHAYVPFAESWGDVRVSPIMPFTWLVQIPGLSGFREAPRVLILGLLPACLLAGVAVNWLRYHLPWLIVPVAMLALLELGWTGGDGRPVATMPTALPALDRPIAADHSGSLVVDVPFGVRAGVQLPGEGAPFNPEAQVLATADGHPRSIGYFSRLPLTVLAAIRRNPFYAGLLAAQRDQSVRRAETLAGSRGYAALVGAAAAEARRMNVGWIIVWRSRRRIRRYLTATGFRFDYRAGGASVYRPDAAVGRGP